MVQSRKLCSKIETPYAAELSHNVQPFGNSSLVCHVCTFSRAERGRGRGIRGGGESGADVPCADIYAALPAADLRDEVHYNADRYAKMTEAGHTALERLSTQP